MCFASDRGSFRNSRRYDTNAAVTTATSRWPFGPQLFGKDCTCLGSRAGVQMCMQAKGEKLPLLKKPAACSPVLKRPSGTMKVNESCMPNILLRDCAWSGNDRSSRNSRGGDDRSSLLRAMRSWCV